MSNSKSASPGSVGIPEGYLEVGRNEAFEVVINLDRDRNGIGHLVFSPQQARNLAKTLNFHATLAEEDRAASTASKKPARKRSAKQKGKK